MATKNASRTTILWVVFVVSMVLGAVLHTGSAISIACFAVALVAATALVVVSKRSAGVSN